MSLMDKILNFWQDFCAAAQPVMQKITYFARELASAFKVVGRLLFKLRKVFLAIPVGWGAVYLAFYNMENLPTVVGLDLQISGDFNLQVVRELAVLGPVALTAVCLLLMVISRRTLTPWLVSVFSLALPVLILFTNTFPG